MTEDQIIQLMDQWDKTDEAMKRLLVAQPATMTEAAARMDRERHTMSEVIRATTRPPRL